MITRVDRTNVDGCLILHGEVYQDHRGSFQELSNQDELLRLGLDWEFKQSNVSLSQPGVLRGMHMQTYKPQGKLIKCIQGKVFDVCVDLRPQSDTFLRWFGTWLDARFSTQLYVPEGCAHGFYSVRWPGEPSMILYQCTQTYDKASDCGIRWDDPDVNVEWPIKAGVVPILSPRDASLPRALEYLKSLE